MFENPLQNPEFRQRSASLSAIFAQPALQKKQNKSGLNLLFVNEIGCWQIQIRVHERAFQILWFVEMSVVR
jgi:hypothetical protein